MEKCLEAVLLEEQSLFPKEAPCKFEYGTAGFRGKADKLDRVIFRMGLLASLRARSLKAAIGVMITASHNPVEDNGMKIVDSQGEMLAQEWEGYANLLANASLSELKTVVTHIMESSSLDFSSLGGGGCVIFARDTRPSSERLVGHLAKGIELFETEMTDYGILTTPQLHYMVCCINTRGNFGEPNEEGYYQKMVSAFNQLLPKDVPSSSLKINLKVDGANGVGADKMKKLLDSFKSGGSDALVLNIEVLNDGTTGVLNESCGADFVKTGQMAPRGMAFSEGDRCASFDGDGDRIVYFYKSSGKFKLLDGDKIAALAAGFICEQLRLMAVDLTIGVVQTAYANGSATEYLKDVLNIPVACTQTGVKHLHHKAKEFDIGIYFEANGHGTVLFSDRSIETFKKSLEDDTLPSATREAARDLLALTRLINQAVGDALSDLLLVEVVLLRRGWGCVEWDRIYTDLPSRLLKVRVKDRMVVETADFARRCVAPDELQEEIDQLVAATSKGRAFVRPSGTEDVVRVYAEAATQESADTLAVQVGVKVHQIADGIGELPTL